jgi:hypothetical protein
MSMISLPASRATFQIFVVKGSSVAKNVKSDLLRRHLLNEGRLVTNGVELTERFLVVEKFHIIGWEATLRKNIFHFFALERRRTDHGDAE